MFAFSGLFIASVGARRISAFLGRHKLKDTADVDDDVAFGTADTDSSAPPPPPIAAATTTHEINNVTDPVGILLCMQDDNVHKKKRPDAVTDKVRKKLFETDDVVGKVVETDGVRNNTNIPRNNSRTFPFPDIAESKAEPRGIQRTPATAPMTPASGPHPAVDLSPIVEPAPHTTTMAAGHQSTVSPSRERLDAILSAGGDPLAEMMDVYESAGIDVALLYVKDLLGANNAEGVPTAGAVTPRNADTLTTTNQMRLQFMHKLAHSLDHAPPVKAHVGALLPPGFTAHVDTATGETYFYEHATGAVSWTLPGELPDGWIAQVDETTGERFYVNSQGTRQWERPVEVCPPRPPPYPGRKVSKGDETSLHEALAALHRNEAKAHAQATAAAAAAAAAAAPVTLSPLVARRRGTTSSPVATAVDVGDALAPASVRKQRLTVEAPQPHAVGGADSPSLSPTGPADLSRELSDNLSTAIAAPDAPPAKKVVKLAKTPPPPPPPPAGNATKEATTTTPASKRKDPTGSKGKTATPDASTPPAASASASTAEKAARVRQRAVSTAEPMVSKSARATRTRAVSAASPPVSNAADNDVQALPRLMIPSDTPRASMSGVGSPVSSLRYAHNEPGTPAPTPRSYQMYEQAFMTAYGPASYRNKTGTQEIVPLSVKQFCAQFFDDHASYSLGRHQESIGDQNVQTTPWVAAAEDGYYGWCQTFTREVHFSKAVTNPMAGVKRTRAIKSQQLRKFGAAGAMLLTSTRLLDIPYNNVFTVEESVVVRAYGDTHAAVDFSFEVKFVQHSILKSAIEGGTNPEMRRWMMNYMMCVKSWCGHAAETYAAAAISAVHRPSVSRRPSFDDSFVGTPQRTMSPTGSWGSLRVSPRGTPSASPLRVLPRSPLASTVVSPSASDANLHSLAAHSPLVRRTRRASMVAPTTPVAGVEGEKATKPRRSSVSDGKIRKVAPLTSPDPIAGKLPRPASTGRKQRPNGGALSATIAAAPARDRSAGTTAQHKHKEKEPPAAAEPAEPAAAPKSRRKPALPPPPPPPAAALASLQVPDEPYLGLYLGRYLSLTSPYLLHLQVPDEPVADVDDTSAAAPPFEEVDVRTLDLATWQLQAISDTLAAPQLCDPSLLAAAWATHMPITAHLVYRFLASTQWTMRYDNKSIVDAIVDTVHWRMRFGIATIDTSAFAHLIHAGLGYTGGYDQHGRVILYMKVNRAGRKLESNQTYLNMLMYTLERADRMCADRARGANGTFIVVIDLEGFSLTGGLPFSVIKEFFAHTAHYPFRINGIYLINSNASFNFLWGLMKGMLPKRIEKQTYMLGRATGYHTICEHLGPAHVEAPYGGYNAEGPGDVHAYLQDSYWARVCAAAAENTNTSPR